MVRFVPQNHLFRASDWIFVWLYVNYILQHHAVNGWGCQAWWNCGSEKREPCSSSGRVSWSFFCPLSWAYFLWDQGGQIKQTLRVEATQHGCHQNWSAVLRGKENHLPKSLRNDATSQGYPWLHVTGTDWQLQCLHSWESGQDTSLAHFTISSDFAHSKTAFVCSHIHFTSKVPISGGGHNRNVLKMSHKKHFKLQTNVKMSNCQERLPFLPSWVLRRGKRETPQRSGSAGDGGTQPVN